MNDSATHFALCPNNSGYPASFEVGKLYRVVEDADAAAEGYIRVVDESDEDYAFAANRFHLVDLPAKIEKTLMNNQSEVAAN